MKREMIYTCINNNLIFRFVLMDSWFSSKENFDFITGKGKHFISISLVKTTVFRR